VIPIQNTSVVELKYLVKLGIYAKSLAGSATVYSIVKLLFLDGFRTQDFKVPLVQTC